MAASVDNSQISNLGLNGRDYLKFLLLTPGATQDVRTGDLSFGGLRARSTNLQVDGSDNDTNFYGQAVGRTATGRTNFGTYTSQSLDNRILQVSGKIVF